MSDFVVKNGLQLGGSVKGNVGTVTLGTGGYNLGIAAYDGVSFSVSSQATIPSDIVFDPSGTKMYILERQNKIIYQYALSTAWDVSTASYGGTSFTISLAGIIYGIAFSPDGTKLFMLDNSFASVRRFSLSSAWNVSTASDDSSSYSVYSQVSGGYAIVLSPDGTKMYVMAGNNSTLYQYTLSTAFDLGGVSYSGKSFNVGTQGNQPFGISFNGDGTKLFTLSNGQDSVFQYSLSTAYDISTASYDSVSFSVTTQETVPIGLAFNSNGSKMYVVGNTNDTVFQYTTGISATLDLSTADAFEITPTVDLPLAFSNPPASGNAQSFSIALTGVDFGSSYDLANASYDSVSFSVAGQETSPTGLFFKPDGTKMYALGLSGDDVNEYNLSPAWDITTASYAQNFSVSTQTGYPQAMFFKSDGTKMYIAAQLPGKVFEYNLSTAWDISTASYLQAYDVTAQVGVSKGLSFKPDGTKMYVLDASYFYVNEYSLSTAWDISSSSYTQNFYVGNQEYDASGIFFKPDGNKMYVVGYQGDDINEYSLSTAWNITTASYVRVFSVSSQDTYPMDLFFKPDGTKMYVIGTGTNSVYQYSTGSVDIATITYPSSTVWSGGTAPASPADGVTDLLTFYTEDGGNTYYSFKAGGALA